MKRIALSALLVFNFNLAFAKENKNNYLNKDEVIKLLQVMPDSSKIINDYKAGYVFNFSKKNIQNYLDKFMSLNDDERYRMGLNGLTLAKENFDSQSIFKKYEDLYSSLI